MNLPDLKHNYYNAHVESAKIGPLREVTLTLLVHPNPSFYNWSVAETVTVWFGTVYNIEEAKTLFKRLAQDWDRVDPLHYLRYAADPPSKPGSLYIEIEWDRSDDYLKIHCRDVSVSTGKKAENVSSS